MLTVVREIVFPPPFYFCNKKPLHRNNVMEGILVSFLNGKNYIFFMSYRLEHRI